MTCHEPRPADASSTSQPAAAVPAVTAPIFVVGAARSGTTLLQSMIDAHPDVALVGELHFFDQVMRLRETVPEPFDAAGIAALRRGILKCHASQFVPDLLPALDLALARLATDPAPTYRQLFAHLLAAFAELAGARRVGEKTPSNVRYLREIVGYFPDARIVHILRDPRDSISSRMRYPFTSSSVIFNTLLWKIEMIYALDFASDPTTAADRYMEVRYEDLVAAPETVLAQVADFIGIDLDPAMLAAHRRADRVVKDEPWKSGIGQPVNQRSVGAWRQRLSPAEVGLLEYVAGDYLGRTGYTPESTVGRPRVLVQALGDICHYVPYKLREAWQARRAEKKGEMIGSESAKINAMLLRALH